MIRSMVLGVVIGTALGCQPSSPELASAGGDVLIPACAWSPAADTFDPSSGVGCSPRSMFQVCEVPEGSVVHADGTITTPDGATVTCDDACSASEYALTCSWRPDGETAAPAPSLGCRPIPIPTPANAQFHCCPCSQ